jgi:hypothetical protein
MGRLSALTTMSIPMLRVYVVKELGAHLPSLKDYTPTFHSLWTVPNKNIAQGTDHEGDVVG